jgi:hypothetical protein
MILIASGISANVASNTGTLIQSDTSNNKLNNLGQSNNLDQFDKTSDLTNQVNIVPITPYVRYGSSEKSYDEYDDKNLLNAKDEELINTVDNVIVDGNNLIYKVHEYEGNEGHPTVKEYFDLLKKIIQKLYDELPGKAILFVIKDPETESQSTRVKEYLNCKTIKSGYKKHMSALVKKYPSVRIVVAYGKDKPRDDFAALWLSDQLGDKTILLSRDRYSDVTKTNRNVDKVEFITYGKNASKYNKILNKPFAHIDKSSRTSLVGYSFSKKHKSAFYQKDINKKSEASDYVFLINMKNWK